LLIFTRNQSMANLDFERVSWFEASF